jgi:GTPase
VNKQKESIKLDIRILLLGETGSGKTSLLGVLTTGEADDGEGLARARIHKNLKSLLTGKTERIQHNVICFDSSGNIINH